MGSKREDTFRTLGLLGISEEEELVYRWLLPNPGASAQEISEALPYGLRKIQQSLNALEISGFVTHSPERPRRYLPASPDIAIGTLVHNRQDGLEKVLSVIPDLKKLAARRSSKHEQVVELITSREAQRKIFEQLPGSAEKEVISLIRPPVLISRLNISPEKDHFSQREAQNRGVTFRSVVDKSFLEIPGALQSTRADIKAGEEVRAIPDLPFKMMIADHSTALIPLYLEHPHNPCLLLRSSALLDALCSLFETIWEHAVPIGVSIAGSVERETVQAHSRHDHEELITLMASGLNDKSIACEFGISSATLNRRIAAIMKSLGVRTRFQAGWQARGLFQSGERNKPLKRD